MRKEYTRDSYHSCPNMISELRKPINISFGAALLLFLLVVFQFIPREVIYLPALRDPFSPSVKEFLSR